MEITENFNISDEIGPHGFVVIKDQKTGKILFKGSNMIVKAGREYVFYKFLSSIFTDNTTFEALDNTYNGYSLNKIKLGSGLKEVTFNDNSLSAESPILSSELSTDNNNTSGVTISFVRNSTDNYKLFGHPYIKITIKDLTNENTTAGISELGLFLSNPEKEDDIMFSRIRIDTIPFDATTALSLDYYIYF